MSALASSRRRAVLWLAAGLALLFTGTVSFAAWGEPALRSRVRLELETFLDELCPGQVHIDRIAALSLAELHAQGVTVVDPQGRSVLRAESVRLGLDLPALLTGALRFSHGVVEGARVRAIPSDSVLSLFSALAPDVAGASDREGSSLKVQFEHIHVRDAMLYGDLPSLPNVRVEPLEVRGRIQIDQEFHAQVTQARGRMLRPFREPLDLLHAVTTVDTGPVSVRAAARVAYKDDRAHVSLRYRMPQSAPDHLSLVVGLKPISPAFLTNLGVVEAATLLPDLRGHMGLEGPLSRLAYRAALQTEAGHVQLSGAWPDHRPLTLNVKSDRLDLEQLIAYGPPVRLSFAAHAEVPETGPVHVDARSPALEVYGIAFHDAHVRGNYQDARFSLQAASVAYAGGRFQLEGWVDAEANADLHVQSARSRIESARVVRERGLRGSLATNMRVIRHADILSLSGSLGLFDFEASWGSASELRIDGSVRFADADFAAPSADLRISAEQFELLDYTLGKLRGTFRGERGLYVTRLQLDSPGQGDAVLSANLTAKDGTYRVEASRCTLHVHGRPPWIAEADLVFDSSEATFRRLSLTSGAQRLDLQGSYAYDHAYQFDVTLEQFDLGGLRELTHVDLADLEGTADATVTLQGGTGLPRIRAQGAVRNGRFLGIEDLSLTLSLAFARGDLELDTELVLPEGSAVSVRANGSVGPGGQLATRLVRGEYAFQLRFDRVPFSVAEPWLSWWGITPPPGSVSAVARGSGPLSAPTLELTTQVHGLELAPYPPLDISLTVAHEKRTFKLSELNVRDPQGELLSARGELRAPMEALGDLEALRASLAGRTLSLELAWPNRRLDQLPGALRLAVPVRSRGRLSLRQAQGTWKLEGQARFTTASELAMAACGLSGRPVADATLSGTKDQLKANIALQTGLQVLGRLSLTTQEAPLMQWLSGLSGWSLPRVRAEINAATDAAEELPIACEYAAGPLSLQAFAADLFGPEPGLTLRASSPGLQLVPNRLQQQRLGNLRDAQTAGRPFAISLEGSSQKGQLDLSAHIEQEGGGELWTEARLPRPLWLTEASPATSGQVEVSMRTSRLQLAPILLALPISTRAGGLLSGSARLRYDLADASLHTSGSLLLRKGTAAIASLGQQLSDLTARVVFDEHVIRIEDVAAHDFDGLLAASGELNVKNLERIGARVNVELRGFPVRREGTQVSRLTGPLQIDARIGRRETQALLTINDLLVQLPSDLGLGLQPLELHPDIIVEGEARPRAPEDPYTLELQVVASRPFRVVRSDLNAEVLANVNLHYRDPALTMHGSAEIKRGRVELYGKRFDLQESRLAFDKNDQLDPLVSLYATHKTGGDVIGVRVDGRLSAPQVTFTHSDPNINDKGAIIAQLLGARRTSYEDDQSLDPGAAAAGVLAGATAGLLTEEVRRKLGGAVPVLSMEASSSSQRAYRIRAGVHLDQLIERRLGPLRHVVRGAYIEGFVAPGADPHAVQDSAPPQSRAGGLLELTFPRDLIGSVEYQPTQNWRIDMAWEP